MDHDIIYHDQQYCQSCSRDIIDDHLHVSDTTDIPKISVILTPMPVISLLEGRGGAEALQEIGGGDMLRISALQCCSRGQDSLVMARISMW